MAVDGSGDIFIADTGNQRVREVNSSTGNIGTVAGNGTAGYLGDGGLATATELKSPWSVAVDAKGDLFIADSGNNRLREVSASGIITTLAGNGTSGYAGDGGPASAAELAGPEGVALDSVATFSSPTPPTIGSARWRHRCSSTWSRRR